MSFYIIMRFIFKFFVKISECQEEASKKEAVKRIKLEYDELSSCSREVVEVWDLLISKESRISTKCNNQMLLHAIKQGKWNIFQASTQNYSQNYSQNLRIFLISLQFRFSLTIFKCRCTERKKGRSLAISSWAILLKATAYRHSRFPELQYVLWITSEAAHIPTACYSYRSGENVPESSVF